mmetsp:Transcript_44384/g.32440  ORF Transcript_44384/g.32440 Transcript_44384/m.32440 type:complete len:94 (+) Transcript_44384:723-1004(+)
MFGAMIAQEEAFAKLAVNENYIQKLCVHLDTLLGAMKAMAAKYVPCKRSRLEFLYVQTLCVKLQRSILDMMTHIDIKTRAYENKKLVKKDFDD